MTSAVLAFFMSDLLSIVAMTTCAMAMVSLLLFHRCHHWPLYVAAFVTALAYGVRLALPDAWTPTVYIAFEAAVGLLALFVGARRPWVVQQFMFGACAAGAILIAGENCAAAYVLLGVASMTAAVCVSECHPRDRVEEIARLGLSMLLAFQAARGLLAFAACEEPVLMAMLSAAGWAVHVTAFGLIAWAARR